MGKRPCFKVQLKGGDFFRSKPLLIDVFGPDLLENTHNERI